MPKLLNRSSKDPAAPAWLFVSLFLLTLGVYLSTLNPSLFRNDSPETITACGTLGVPHPPSYPLHTLLGRLVFLLPLGNPAFSLNFFSALLGSLGVCLLAGNLWRFLSPLTGRAFGARFALIAVTAAGSLSLAFSKSYWSASLSAKGGIYILQVVLELALLSTLQNLAAPGGNPKTFRPRNGAFFLFVFALGLLNHWPTQMLLLPGLGLLALLVFSGGKPGKAKGLPAKEILRGAGLLSLILSLYLYLPLRSHLFPHLNFGDPSSFHRLMASLLRLDYAKVETMAAFLPTIFETLQGKAAYISSHFLNEFHPLFLVLSIPGIFLLVKKNRKKELLFLLITLFTTLTVNLFYLRLIPLEYWHLDDHLLSANWITALLSAGGAYFCLAWVGQIRGQSNARFPSFPLLAGLLVFLLPLPTLLQQEAVNNQTREFLFRDYGLTALRSLEPHSLYFAEGDYDYFPLLYLTEVEGKRPDVRLFSAYFLDRDYEYALIARRFPNLLPEGLGVPLRQGVFFHWLASNPTHFPLYCAYPNGSFSEMYLRHNPRLSFKPQGLLTRLNPGREADLPASTPSLLAAFWERDLAAGRRSTHPINGLFLELCAHPYVNAARYGLLRGDRRTWEWGFSRALTLATEKEWRGILFSEWAAGELAGGDRPETIRHYRESCLEFLQAGKKAEAREAFQKALQAEGQPGKP